MSSYLAADTMVLPDKPRKLSVDPSHGHYGDGWSSPSSSASTPEYKLRALRTSSHAATSPSASSPHSPTPRNRSPFARAAARRRSQNGTSPPRSRPSTPSRRALERKGSLSETLDDLTAELGDFLDHNFLEILYGIAVAMLLVVLVTSVIARAYIPPYKGWDSERRIYVAAMWYSGTALVLLIAIPLVGPMAWNMWKEFHKLSSTRTSKAKAALHAFRKGWKTGIIFYDSVGDRYRKMAGLPPMEVPLRSRLCV